MRSSTNHLAQAKRVFAKNQSMLRTSDAIRLGIHPRTLYLLRDKGQIEQISRGLFRLKSAKPLENPDWATVAAKIPRGVICLISALSHHGLTTQVPHAIDLALPSHARIPKLDYPPIRIFWFSNPAFSSGVDTFITDGVAVRVYSPEKTIADCFKYRNKIGLDVAVEALKSYRERSKKPNLKLVLKFAELNRVHKTVRPYLEAMMLSTGHDKSKDHSPKCNASGQRGSASSRHGKAATINHRSHDPSTYRRRTRGKTP